MPVSYEQIQSRRGGGPCWEAFQGKSSSSPDRVDGGAQVDREEDTNIRRMLIRTQSRAQNLLFINSVLNFKNLMLRILLSLCDRQGNRGSERSCHVPRSHS